MIDDLSDGEIVKTRAIVSERKREREIVTEGENRERVLKSKTLKLREICNFARLGRGMRVWGVERSVG